MFYDQASIPTLKHIPQTSGVTRYVDASSAAGSSLGLTPETAIATITAAIAAASAGDIIIVKAGAYAEDVDISKAVQVICEPLVYITGSITFSADNGHISGFILGSAVTPATLGVDFGTQTFCSIKNANIVGAFDDSVYMDGDYNIAENIDCSGYVNRGFVLTEASCKILNCNAVGASGGEEGFVLSATADHNTIERCVSRDNDGNGFIVTAGATDNIIKDCASLGDDGYVEDGGTRTIIKGLNYKSQIEKSITIATATLAYNLFQVIGTVKIKKIYGVIETATPAAVTDVALELFPTGGAAIDISVAGGAGLDISSMPVGTLISRDATVITALTKNDSTLGFVKDNNNFDYDFFSFIIAQKPTIDTFIRMTKAAGAGDSGAIRWYVEWEPISRDGKLIVA